MMSDTIIQNGVMVEIGVRFINGYKKTYGYPNCKSLWARRRLRSVWPRRSD